MHPSHAVYASTQNLVSYLAENLSILPELDEYNKIAGDAEDEYMPGYPPMSPLTISYFTLWAFFDLRFGRDRETIGTCLSDIGSEIGIHKGYIELIRILQESRMGIYSHQGLEGKSVLLYEIFTKIQYRCHVGSGYTGRKNEIWFTRIIPPPFNINDQYIVITTPYVVIETLKVDWGEYFNRTLPRVGIDPPILAYTELMKHGLEINYWNEYIFQAYYNFSNDVIYLMGTPDKPETLPHSGKYLSV
ncbi:MAG TPA: hypothetical protein ENH85_14690 [Candidatus Scalindua sp.]|nr:hypothetical protein [Candidatus Scalindua sp.]